MKNYEKKYIQQLIDQGEHGQLDFKFEINDARKIARTLVAFANTEGGRLLVGVKDNGKISGIRSEEEYYMVESAAHLYCKPAIKFDTRSWKIDGKTVLEVYVPPSAQKPSYAKDDHGRWLAYHRVKDENLLANKVLLDLWRYEKQDSGTLIAFTRHESLLLKYLRQHPESSLSAILRDTGFRRQKMIALLVKLIAFDVVRMEFRDKMVLYSLSDSPGE
jgi:predicted HTH transcriptional regulator